MAIERDGEKISDEQLEAEARAFLQSRPGCLLVDEIQLLDWGESRAGGPWLKIRLPDPELLDRFRGLDIGGAKRTGHVLHMVLMDQPQPAPPAEESGEQRTNYGSWAELLRQSGFCRTPSVWASLGNAEQLADWIRAKKCASCGWEPHEDMGKMVRCEAAHVRRIAQGAGVGRKPEWFMVPLCPASANGCHRKQHAHGESALGGKEKLEQLALGFVEEWAWQRLKVAIGFDRMKYAPPTAVLSWAEKFGLERLLPAAYRDAALKLREPAA